MFESRIVEIEGTFLGALIVEADRKTRRFYAAHDSVRPLHNRVLAEADELTRQVVGQFRRAHADSLTRAR
ncbi:hypothetical protein AA12717_1952 [Gluconacetobacter sacchari DSM 12717]|uniref:Uncharacterized protein n=2 Tax=Gluconacetobacter sacchari TaxID=92759 RepID=A0A7W4IC23_9PROT|nr:hypothetical protein [Gluconacetobacter sacchari]MBB2160128.1 hypothetical protein [Gluconacetobacter sacchari]GBQ25014.1 hypothetical protein AA12717_1952 [Gluconacetobacter sacchari DSM 12717]